MFPLWGHVPTEKWDGTGNTLWYFMWKGEYNHHFCLVYNFSSVASLSSPPDGALVNFHHIQLYKWILTEEKLHELFRKVTCFRYYCGKNNSALSLSSFAYKKPLFTYSGKNKIYPYAKVIKKIFLHICNIFCLYIIYYILWIRWIFF